MKRILILVTVLAVVSLAAGHQHLRAARLTQPLTPSSKNGAPLQPATNTPSTQGPTPQDRELAAQLRQLTNRSTQGLVQEKHPNGGYQLNLKGRFQNVSLAKLGPQGKPVVGCVDSLNGANAFFGRNLETGQPLPNKAKPDSETARQAAQTGLSEREYRFYQDLIEQAARHRKLAPNNATITLFNDDGIGEGFNDLTPKAAEGGNNGATLGAQRVNLFNQAAAIWGAFLDSSVPTIINAKFNPLSPCSETGGILGAAGAGVIHRDFPGAIFPGTWYHEALANKLSDEDRSTAPEIIALFNSDVDNGCLGTGTRFYYGFDNATPPGTVNLLVVLLHELGHGLGFSTFIDAGSGELPVGFPDVYSRFIFDRDVNLHWHEMTNAQRQASALNTNDVLWDGPNVRLASGFLSAGREIATGRVELYTPDPLDNAASISHWNTTATPNLLMEPLITPGLSLNLDLTRQLMRDLGWYRDSNVDLVPDLILSVLPNTGSVTGGLPTNVSWTNVGGFNRNVAIELSTDGGTTFPITLASDVVNTGSRSVTIPNTPTTQARVRVREYNFVEPAEISASNFTIVNGSNTVPTISAVAVNRQQGNAVTNVTIANVNDPNQTLNTLGVTVNESASATVNGVTVSGLSVNAAGVVTANVVATCTATSATFTLTVTDAVMATATATLTVTVTANTAPVLTYSNQTLLSGAALNISPATGPSDNGLISTIALLSQGTYTGTIGVNNSTGVVAISNAAPIGMHTITVRATDNCGAQTDASFTLTVNNNLPQITAAAPLARTQGGTSTATTIATVSDVETAAASLTVVPTTIPPGLSVTGLANTNGTITATVTAACDATLGSNTVVLTVTDGNGGMSTANLTVNVATNSAPVLTYNNQSVASNGALMINPATGPSDNGTINSIVLQNQGTYTGTISVNNITGVVTISNAIPIGAHTITVRVTDNCLTFTDATFTLNVGNNAPQITAGGTFARQQGSPAGAAVQIATVSDVETAAGSLTVAATTVPSGISITDITNTNGTITAVLAAGCSAALGNNNVILTVTDANNGMATANLTVNVTPNSAPVLTYTNQSVAAGGALNVNPATSPTDNGTINSITLLNQSTYTGTITVNNSSGVVSFSTAKPGGTHTITVRITDNCGTATDAMFTLTVNCPMISVNPATLPNGTVGVGYNQTLTVSGGTVPYSFATSAGTLPTGIMLSSDGVLSGTPSAGGTFSFTVQATDANGCTGTRAYTVTINTLPTISAVAVSRQQGSPAAGPTIANVNDADQALNTLTVTVEGGTSATVNGVTVSGLSVSAAGVVIANVVANCTATTANFMLTVTDNAAATATATLTVTVTPNTAPTLTYSNQTLTTGGSLNVNPATGPSDNGTVSNIVVQDPGTYTGTINVNSSTGVIALSNAKPSGTHTITIRITDNCNVTTDASFTLTLNCPTIAVNPASLPNGTIGANYNQTITASGGATPYSFTATNLNVPGLSLSPSGVLSGIPTGFGAFNFTVRATDASGCVGERPYTLTINQSCATLTVSPTTLPNGFQGTAYSQTLTAAGGTAPYTFMVTTGNLPDGLTVATDGALMGTPTAAGTFNFTVKATDNNSCMGTRAYTVIVSGNGLQFYPLAAPVRLLDTRPGASPNACSQPNAPITGQTAFTQLGRGICTIPSEAVALTGNITTVQSGGGFLTLYPSDATRPTVANTNYGVNEIINNVFTVGLGADGAFKIFARDTTDVVVDVTGYYAPPDTGGLYFHPLPAPVRLLETRAGFSGCVMPGTPLIGQTESTQKASSACTGIPAAARAIVGNATTVGPQGGGFLTIFPAEATRPLVASSNFNTGQIVNGPFVVGLSITGHFNIFTTSTTDLVVDVLGYYSTQAVDANGAGLLFNPLAHPVRLLETRAGQPIGCFKPGAPLNAQQEYTQPARGVCDGITIPANALGVVGNATVVLPAGQGFLTLWPSTATRPLVATSNYNPGDVGNRHFIVGLGQADGAFKIFSNATTELVIDLSGYFAP